MKSGLPALFEEAAKPSPSDSPFIVALDDFSSPSLPRCSTHSTDGYIVESTSASTFPRSQWMMRVGSISRTFAIA